MCQAALSCGLVAVGSCHGELTESLLQAIMEHADKRSNETHLRHLALGLALLYLGKSTPSYINLLCDLVKRRQARSC